MLATASGNQQTSHLSPLTPHITLTLCLSRFDENFSRDYTKIKFVTEGILIREMMGDPLLTNYSVIMLDEVHERTAQIDIIMGLLKKILKRRRDLKLIISSATVDAEYIRDFFNRGKENSKTDAATILSVEGERYRPMFV